MADKYDNIAHGDEHEDLCAYIRQQRWSRWIVTRDQRASELPGLPLSVKQEDVASQPSRIEVITPKLMTAFCTARNI